MTGKWSRKPNALYLFAMLIVLLSLKIYPTHIRNKCLLKVISEGEVRRYLTCIQEKAHINLIANMMRRRNILYHEDLVT